MNKNKILLFSFIVFIALATGTFAMQSFGMYWYIPYSITGRSLVFNVTAYNWGNETPDSVCYIIRNESVCITPIPQNFNMMNYSIYNASEVNTSYIHTDNYCWANNNSCYNLSELVGGGTGDNVSWNESYANTLFLNRTSEADYLSTYNSTYESNNDTMRDYVLWVNSTNGEGGELNITGNGATNNIAVWQNDTALKKSETPFMFTEGNTLVIEG